MQSPLQAAEFQVLEIWGEISVLGANDSEPEAIREIVRQLRGGEISPEQAVSKARGIRDSKQDYH